MRVALYLRRSTNEDLQPDSLSAQEEILTTYANEHGWEIGPIYRDSASGRSVTGRTDFAKLVRDASVGADFEVVLVRDVSRWGRFLNIDEGAYWEFFFLIHGVRIHYVQETFRDDRTPYANLMKSLKRVIAAEFSRDKSRMIQYGCYRAVKAGFRLGGDPPYGMVRVLVDAAGDHMQTLVRGQRKALVGQHIKLAPGAANHVRVVRRIFRLHTRENQSPAAIAKILNEDGVPPPHTAAKWRSTTVAKMLRNPAYAGFACGRFVASQNFPQQLDLMVEKAWKPIVDRATWGAAQETFEFRRWRRSPDGLALQLRELFEKWGVIAPAYQLGESGPTEGTYRKYFDDGDNGAILHAYADRIRESWQGIHSKMVDAGMAVVADGDVLVIGGTLRVGYAAAFPRAHHLGRVHWRFNISDEGARDITIGIAMSPEGEPAFYFRFVDRLLKKKPITIARHMYTGSRTRAPHRSLDQIIASLRRDTMRYSGSARDQFLDAIKDLPLVNTQEVSRSLGWPESKGYGLYRKLKAEGVPLPPLKKKFGRRMTLVCDDCGLGRTMMVGNAMLHDSSFCAPCWRLRQAKWATCPDCGATRRVFHGGFKKLKDGVNARCHPCNLKFWRDRYRERWKNGEIEVTKRDAAGHWVAGSRYVRTKTEPNHG